MRVFFGKQPQEIYFDQLETLIRDGERVDVRGRMTVELLDCVTEVHAPWDPCILMPSRRWNPWLAMSEGLWILAGRNDVAALKPYNSHIVDFSDNGETMYGAYGKRMFNQIDPLINRLKADPSDRRAVLQIWDARSDELDTMPGIQGDLTAPSKDPPCNNLVYFKLRDNKLHMTVICRSNDIHWGLYAVNLPTFAMLQQYIAARLGVGLGIQRHLSNSLHFYVDDTRANTITIHMLGEHHIQEYPQHALMFETLKAWDHQHFAAQCGLVLDDEEVSSEPTLRFLRFARDFLRMYRNRRWQPEELDLRYGDWIQAGQNFVEEVWGYHG